MAEANTNCYLINLQGMGNYSDILQKSEYLVAQSLLMVSQIEANRKERKRKFEDLIKRLDAVQQKIRLYNTFK